jgi:hypothetical protein
MPTLRDTLHATELSPYASMRQYASCYTVSQAIACRTFHEQLYPNHVQFVQTLQLKDLHHQTAFSQPLSQQDAADQNFLSHVLIMNEACFTKWIMNSRTCTRGVMKISNEFQKHVSSISFQ